MTYRLCPDVEKIENKEKYKVKNSYLNEKDKVRFSIEIHGCVNDQFTDKCKDKEDIQQVIDHFYFTIFTVVERVDYEEAQHADL